jgi:hypothetical protein
VGIAFVVDPKAAGNVVPSPAIGKRSLHQLATRAMSRPEGSIVVDHSND